MKEWSVTKLGFSLVEVILTSSLFVLITTAIVGALIYSRESSVGGGQRSRATLLAEEGFEAARNIRDAAFSNLTDGTFGLATVGNQWNLSGNQDTTDIFTRQISIAPVDANTKQITATVTWQQTPQRPGSVSLVSYLTNWAAPAAGWAAPFLQAPVDLPGGQDGTKIQVSGDYAYVVRNSASHSFAVVSIADPAAPTIVGSLNFQDNPKNLAVSGSYVYITSKKNSAELQIINIANPAAPVQVGEFNPQGEADGGGIYLAGQTAYLGREESSQSEFYIVNVSNPASPSELGNLNLKGDANEIVVLGSFAYVASSYNAREFQVVDISNAASPTLVSHLDLAGDPDGLTIAGFGSTVVVGRSDGTLAVIDVTDPRSPQLVNTFNALGSVNDTSLGRNNSYVFLATGASTQEFQVVDITNPSTPTSVGVLDVGAELLGVAYHETKDRAFASGKDNAEDFIVVAPSP